jgi:hypothetical protein
MFSRQVSTKEAEEYAEKMGCLFIGELKYESLMKGPLADGIRWRL